MKITNVKVETVITINGKKYVCSSSSWTESIRDAKKSGVEFDTVQDVFNWIEIN